MSSPTSDHPHAAPPTGAGSVPERPGTTGDPVADVTARARDLLGAAVLDDAALRRFLHALPPVDEAATDRYAAALGDHSPRVGAPPTAGAPDASDLRTLLDLAVRAVDLTTLEATDTPDTVRALCARAVRPDPDDPRCPPVAAVCVHADLVPAAVAALRGPDAHPGADPARVRVAAVAGAFPHGRATRRVKVLDVLDAVEAGADEIDTVIDRGAFLSGRYLQVLEDVAAVRDVCHRDGRDVHLKVILETGEFGGLDAVRRASWLAMLGGADVIKTSTGKTTPAATVPVTVVMLRAVRDWSDRTSAAVGVKAAGGIRTADQALHYLAAVRDAAGPRWLHPDLFRFGASRLLDDLVRARRDTAR